MKRTSTNSIVNFIVFFMLIAFVVTCNFLLFLAFMDIDEAAVREAAPLTFWNIILLSLIFCIIDAFRRRQTIAKPVRRIREGIDRVIKGDFSTRIKYIHGENSLTLLLPDLTR